MSNDNEKGTVFEGATMQQVDKFAEMNFDHLLSAYAIAYKASDVDTFKEYRKEIMERVRKLQEVKRILKGVFL